MQSLSVRLEGLKGRELHFKVQLYKDMSYGIISNSSYAVVSDIKSYISPQGCMFCKGKKKDQYIVVVFMDPICRL
jgi:hypothetical protein